MMRDILLVSVALLLASFEALPALLGAAGLDLQSPPPVVQVAHKKLAGNRDRLAELLERE